MRLVSYRRVEVVGEMLVADELGNRNGVLFGGAIMALAVNLWGLAASLNLPAGARTTTLESKINFLRPIPLGQTVRAAAVVTQTQLGCRPERARDEWAYALTECMAHF